MSSSKGAPAPLADSWCWRRWITVEQRDLWLDRLRDEGIDSWALTEKPKRVRLLLTAYFSAHSAAGRIADRWGGKVGRLAARQWLAPRPSPPLRIGRTLCVVSEKPRGSGDSAIPQLHIPHGVAFGSGEHATTSMLLRALVQRRDPAPCAVLDLGTGSGVLALAARLLGARRIVATDWDAEAVRTAGQNEALNFSSPLVRWQRADVRRLGTKARYDLVLANLFSGILIEAAGPIAGAVAAGGDLWLSGILRTQQADVIAAYEGCGLRLNRVVRRGKWVMLAFDRPAGKRPRKPPARS